MERQSIPTNVEQPTLLTLWLIAVTALGLGCLLAFPVVYEQGPKPFYQFLHELGGFFAVLLQTLVIGAVGSLLLVCTTHPHLARVLGSGAARPFLMLWRSVARVLRPLKDAFVAYAEAKDRRAYYRTQPTRSFLD